MTETETQRIEREFNIVHGWASTGFGCRRNRYACHSMDNGKFSADDEFGNVQTLKGGARDEWIAFYKKTTVETARHGYEILPPLTR